MEMCKWRCLLETEPLPVRFWLVHVLVTTQAACGFDDKPPSKGSGWSCGSETNMANRRFGVKFVGLWCV
jgi:hypothetical protein